MSVDAEGVVAAISLLDGYRQSATYCAEFNEG